MGNRRAFLTVLGAVSSASAALGITAKSTAESAATPSPVASAVKAPSAAALAVAATFRAFDAKLSDAEIAAIARNIDDARSAAATLHPKTKALRNSDEMVVRFAADQRVPD